MPLTEKIVFYNSEGEYRTMFALGAIAAQSQYEEGVLEMLYWEEPVLVLYEKKEVDKYPQ